MFDVHLQLANVKEKTLNIDGVVYIQWILKTLYYERREGASILCLTYPAPVSKYSQISIIFIEHSKTVKVLSLCFNFLTVPAC